MSATDDNQETTAEQSSEVKTYEVEVSGSFTTWIEVEAADEDEAHDFAKERARYSSDWDDDGIYTVETINEVVA